MFHDISIEGIDPYYCYLELGSTVLAVRKVDTYLEAIGWGFKWLKIMDANNKHLNPDNTNTYEEEWAQLTAS